MKTFNFTPKAGQINGSLGLVAARIECSTDPENINNSVLCIHVVANNKLFEQWFIRSTHTSLKAAKEYFRKNYRLHGNWTEHKS